MLQKSKYLKGNTVVEVLIALAIISFCASLAVIIYLNIQKSSLPFFKLKAEELATYYLQDAIKNKTLTDETYKAEEFSIKKTIENHPQFQDCFVIRVIVFDGNKKKLHEMETVVLRQH